MIATYVVSEIRDMLVEGNLSQRKIAKQLGVSRGTVSAIARGKRPDYTVRCRQRSHDDFAPTGPIKRCPECGAMVLMPCLACRIRAMKLMCKKEKWERGKMGK